MKIIKEGHTPEKKNKVFKCEYCGCEFESSEDEYFENDNIIASAYLNQPIYSYSNCPSCHKMCTNIRFTNGGPFGYSDNDLVAKAVKDAAVDYLSTTEAKPHATTFTFKLDSVSTDDDEDESEDEED